MVLILGGTFQMGSPKTELDRLKSESPQHEVTVASFFMSEYPVTQDHWSAVAQMQQVKIRLEESPSRFQGENRPVEQVAWEEAVEFCQRLSRHSGRTYRLPSEAEWEYACRAGTQTPFHYGETITTELANYRGTDDKDRELKDPEWQQRSNRAIAVQCGVSPPLVGEVRATLVAEGKIPAQTTRIDRRGAVVHTENIGRKGKESETTGKFSSPIEPNQDDLSQEVSVNSYHLGLDRDRFATIASSLPVCSTSQLWELSEIINTLLRLQSA